MTEDFSLTLPQSLCSSSTYPTLPMKSGKPPPEVDLSSPRGFSEQRKEYMDNTAFNVLPESSNIASPSIDPLNATSPSYFAPHANLNPPFYTSAILASDSDTSGFASSIGSNIPLLSAPNTYLHFPSTSATASAISQTHVIPTPDFQLKPPRIRQKLSSSPGAEISNSEDSSSSSNLDSSTEATIAQNPNLAKRGFFFGKPSKSKLSVAPIPEDSSKSETNIGELAPGCAVESKTFLKLQAQAAAGTAASISASLKLANPKICNPENQTSEKHQSFSRTPTSSTFDVGTPYIPAFNASLPSLISHHKFRSPSLPVNSLANAFKLPSNLSSISSSELAQLLTNPKSQDSTLVVDVRPFNQYSKHRILSAVNICIPSTLLKRPTFDLSRFGECMIPYQRTAIDNLANYKSVIIYDQSTFEVSTSVYSSIAYTILKFGSAKNLKGRLCYLKGGILSLQTSCPSLIDELEVQISGSTLNSTRSNDISNGSPDDLITINENNSDKHSRKPGHGYSNSQPNNFSLSSSQTFTFTPVLTGFSLPSSSTKDGPLKPFASNVGFLGNFDLTEDITPVSVPSDLSSSELKSYFPLWLQDIINKDTGPRHITRRFYDIEKAEKVRLQSAFNHGSHMVTSSSSASSPVSANSDEAVKYTFSAGVELGAKNRYSNIWPYDHTRVKLPELPTSLSGKGSEIPQLVLPIKSDSHDAPKDYIPKTSCDYFNASYITTKGTSLRYIATQGPLPDTFADFWNVIWAKKIPVIVMLTAETEGHSIKCHRYWNDSIYGGICLKKISSKNEILSAKTGTSVIIRQFVLTPSIGDNCGAGDKSLLSNSHTVTQIQYTSWPDLGSPAYPEDLIALCQLKNAYLEESRLRLKMESEASDLNKDVESPWTLVHCSAGCGRTGTFCTVDSVIDLLQQQITEAPSSYLQHSTSPFHSVLTSLSSLGSQKQARPNDSDALESRDLIYRTVHNFRRQRLSMVQVLRQYALCYETVILWVHNKYNEQHKTIQ